MLLTHNVFKKLVCHTASKMWSAGESLRNRNRLIGKLIKAPRSPAQKGNWIYCGIDDTRSVPTLLVGACIARWKYWWHNLPNLADLKSVWQPQSKVVLLCSSQRSVNCIARTVSPSPIQSSSCGHSACDQSLPPFPVPTQVLTGLDHVYRMGKY
jgi:hypothetical protein